MEATINKKDYNNKVYTENIQAQTKIELFEAITEIHNRGRYTIMSLELQDNELNNEYWAWRKGISIADYYRLLGKTD